MIRYLEQLERDLVEAIDRREPARVPRWRRHPRWTHLVTAAVAPLVIAVGVVMLRPQDRTEHTVPLPPIEHGQPAPIPPGTQLRLVGTVTRVASTTWRGQARGPGGTGTLTITGTVDLSARTCCDTPRSKPRPSSHTIAFTWTTTGGTVRGCIANTIYHRPHGRFVWDGVGRATNAAGTLRRYRGRGVGIAGDTRTATPDQTRIILQDGAPAGSC